METSNWNFTISYILHSVSCIFLLSYFRITQVYFTKAGVPNRDILQTLVLAYALKANVDDEYAFLFFSEYEIGIFHQILNEKHKNLLRITDLE